MVFPVVDNPVRLEPRVFDFNIFLYLIMPLPYSVRAVLNYSMLKFKSALQGIPSPIYLFVILAICLLQNAVLYFLRSLLLLPLYIYLSLQMLESFEFRVSYLNLDVSEMLPKFLGTLIDYCTWSCRLNHFSRRI